ncbi:MAG: DUF2807 domain-containing protein [Halobacteriota archaeon]
MTTEKKSVAPPTSIDFTLHGTLQVAQSDAQSVQVEAASNIISSIRMEVKNDILMIDAA